MLQKHRTFEKESSLITECKETSAEFHVILVYYNSLLLIVYYFCSLFQVFFLTFCEFFFHLIFKLALFIRFYV